MATFKDKFLISLGSAALFTAINLPGTYKLTNSILPFNLFDAATNCPTTLGSLIHTLVFYLITLLSMGDPREDTKQKVKYSIWGSLLFFFLSSPAMYSFVSSIFGRQLASAAGCPTVLGVLVHAAVYLAALIGLMYL